MSLQPEEGPTLTDYLILFAIVLGVNMMPAFGPPTWSILILFGLNSDMPLPTLVLTAALAAALGRLLLAYAFQYLGGRMKGKMKRNLDAARNLIDQRKRNTYMALGLFALSPVPSAQLFEAAGLAKINLPRFTAAFFVGRILSYSFYAYTAKGISHSSFGDAFQETITSPTGIAIQITMLVILFGFTQIDWSKFLKNLDGSVN